MVQPAHSKRKPAPAALRIINGQGPRKRDGVPTDSAGRPIEQSIDFERRAPEKPEELSPDAEWLWDKVVKQMTEIGLLKPLDAYALEVACENFARWREAVRQRQQHALLGKNSQGVVTAPWIGIEERASREFRAWCSEFGITPAAENNLKMESEARGDDNPF